jgi:hypothetical protein
MIRKSIMRTGTTNAVIFLTGLFILVVSALFILSLANTALSLQIVQGGDKNVVTGGVVAVENGSDLSTMILRSSEIGLYPHDEMNIFVSPKTKVLICNDREQFNDLRAGSSATIQYHEEGGIAVADSVAERC